MRKFSSRHHARIKKKKKKEKAETLIAAVFSVRASSRCLSKFDLAPPCGPFAEKRCRKWRELALGFLLPELGAFIAIKQ